VFLLLNAMVDLEEFLGETHFEISGKTPVEDALNLLARATPFL